MPRIDAHQHFWQYDPVRDHWITDEMQIIREDFMPGQLQPLLHANNMDGCIVVQSSQDEAENEFHLGLASQHDFIKGIVGWVDLRAANIHQRLDYYSSFDKMKGFRHMLQGETDRRLMLSDRFRNGIAALCPYNFTYDLLIQPDQLKYATELVAAFPDQAFVIDHIAKPPIATGISQQWLQDLQAIARHEQVYCKLSGLITEADWRHWQPAHLIPFMDAVVHAFGTKRIMFGSDWPVCLLAGSYGSVVQVMENYFSSFSKNEQADFWGNNAASFYNINS